MLVLLYGDPTSLTQKAKKIIYFYFTITLRQLVPSFYRFEVPMFSGLVGINATLIAQRSIDVAQLATHVGQFLSEMGYFNQAESMLQEAHKNLDEVKIVLIINHSLNPCISYSFSISFS